MARPNPPEFATRRSLTKTDSYRLSGILCSSELRSSVAVKSCRSESTLIDLLSAGSQRGASRYPKQSKTTQKSTMKAIKRVKKGAKVGKPSTALLEVEGDREGRSKKEDDALAVMAAAISGKTVEQIHAKWAALRELNKRLEQPAKRRCYV